MDKHNRFRIYHEPSGEWEFDAVYRFVDCDQNIAITLNQIVSINTEQIVIKMDRDLRCTITPVLPAFGGSSWQIMKGRQDFNNDLINH